MFERQMSPVGQELHRTQEIWRYGERFLKAVVGASQDCAGTRSIVVWQQNVTQWLTPVQRVDQGSVQRFAASRE